ncbi:MAG: hypothetical protein KDC71_07450 [Acidobacteria bacterium]|nr:hypothetical protein [Acidobacteriota bacterium]
MSPHQIRQFYRRNLPHYHISGAEYFITTRLSGTLPIKDQPFSFAEMEAHLHQTIEGLTWLANPKVAQIVWDALMYRDGKVYDLHAACIMSNHLHLVFRHLVDSSERGPLRNNSLPGILHSFKRKTAVDANKVLKRKGVFWQDESFDRVIRSQTEWEKIIYYTLNNPVKTSLVKNWQDWPWTYCKWSRT